MNRTFPESLTARGTHPLSLTAVPPPPQAEAVSQPVGSRHGVSNLVQQPQRSDLQGQEEAAGGGGAGGQQLGVHRALRLGPGARQRGRDRHRREVHLPPQQRRRGEALWIIPFWLQGGGLFPWEGSRVRGDPVELTDAFLVFRTRRWSVTR